MQLVRVRHELDEFGFCRRRVEEAHLVCVKWGQRRPAFGSGAVEQIGFQRFADDAPHQLKIHVWPQFPPWVGGKRVEIGRVDRCDVADPPIHPLIAAQHGQRAGADTLAVALELDLQHGGIVRGGDTSQG